MLVESERFESKKSMPKGWEDGVLRYCDILGVSFEGGGPSGALIACTFEDCDWYWALFNIATFVDVTFRRCEFSGVSFSGCRFVECTFEDCRFTDYSFGKPCSFNENSWYKCELVRTSKPVGGLR